MNSLFQKMIAQFDLLPLHSIICDSNHQVIWCAQHANQYCPLVIHLGDDLSQVLPDQQALFSQYQKALQITETYQQTIQCYHMEFAVQISSFEAETTYYIWHLNLQQHTQSPSVDASAYLEISATYRNAIFHIHNALYPLSKTLDQTGMYKQLDYLNAIAENCQSLLKTTLNLNEYLKITSNTAVYHPQLIDLKSVAQSLVEQANFLLKRTGKIVHFSTMGDQFWVRIDPEKLQLTLLNLIANALENTVEEGNIELQLIETQHNVALLLRDNGTGMADAVKAQAFEPFYSHKADLSMAQGLGLGLYLAREFAHAQSGNVMLDSGTDKGTTITMQFPKQDGSLDLVLHSSPTDRWLLDRMSPLYAFLAEFSDCKTF